MEGIKTYTGILILALSYVLKDYMEQSEIEMLVNSLMAVFGIGLAVYGRIKANKRK